jgi:2-amino-4-hydroxy-6-hydroxymethyldihydropteridine diphosphokinase
VTVAGAGSGADLPSEGSSVTAFVGLGSNLEDPPEQLNRAIFELAELPDTRLRVCSAFFWSAPMGPVEQPEYLNAVARLETRLSAGRLLQELQRIEAAHGRKREVRWGPRTLDLDLLLYGDQRVDTPELQLPHPGIEQRNFVLYPLLELAPELVIPGQGKLLELIQECPPDGLRAYEPE